LATFVTIYTEEAHPQENGDYINYFVDISRHRFEATTSSTMGLFAKHRITTLSIMTLNKISLFATLSIKGLFAKSNLMTRSIVVLSV
jgi:hypothetical protein